MSWYADTPSLRTRQLVGDALLLLWCAVWLRVGVAVHRAGEAQERAVGQLALLLAVVVVALPVLWALSRRVPAPLAWAREARAGRALRGDVELLALRAAASRPLRELAALGPEPVGRWRCGEPGAAEALAGLELAALGLSARPARPGPPRR